jgi:hypothetical protein
MRTKQWNEQEAIDLCMAQFEIWWEREGSSMRPFSYEDQEIHTRRLCAIAWANSAYVALRQGDRKP